MDDGFPYRRYTAYIVLTVIVTTVVINLPPWAGFFRSNSTLADGLMSLPPVVLCVVGAQMQRDAMRRWRAKHRGVARTAAH